MSSKYIVGLSGTHGTGKSTIVNGASEAGFTVDRSQLSRSAQAALGWDTLAHAQKNSVNMWSLQNMILQMLCKRDADIEKENTLTLVERTPADLWAYTLMWCSRMGIDPETDTVARKYHDECMLAMQRYNTIMILPPHDDVPFVAEPNRADEISRRQVDEDITLFVIRQNFARSYIIRNVGRAERIAEVVNYLAYARASLTKEKL